MGAKADRGVFAPDTAIRLRATMAWQAERLAYNIADFVAVGVRELDPTLPRPKLVR
jgi:hypothetical protein